MMAPWRKFLPLFVTLVALFSGLWLGRVTAQTPEPGSSGDPLVSKSYVDEMSLYRVVNITAGQTIIGEGGTELVLRAGIATAITSDLGGLLDVTSGADIKQGQQIPQHSMIVIPRSDGRGFKAVTDLVLMVKGPAQVQEGSL